MCVGELNNADLGDRSPKNIALNVKWMQEVTFVVIIIMLNNIE